MKINNETKANLINNLKQSVASVVLFGLEFSSYVLVLNKN
jgi:hypothetical protein